jgi:hypothetical protein
MADEQNTGNRDEEARDDQTQRDRTKQQAGSKDQTDEQTDTLEDRNLSGSSTWATLADEQNASPRTESSDDDSAGNR